MSEISLERSAPDTSGWHSWAIVGLLTTAFALGSADRILPAVLSETLKASFELSDTQLGWLTGSSFAIAMAIFGLPFGWLADRINRFRLLAITSLIWCLCTIASSFATSYTVLFLLRMGVGFGEAALLPAAYSIIGSLFPPSGRGRASAVLTLGMPIGAALAYTVGAWLAASAPIAFVGAEPWRLPFFITGCAALPLVILFAFIPEPIMNHVCEPAGDRTGPSSTLILLIGSASFFVPFIAASMVFTIFSSGYFAWTPALFQRVYDWPLAKVGAVSGVVTLAAGIIGGPVGAWFNEIMTRRLGRDATLWTISLTTAITLVAAISMPVAPDGDIAFAGLFVVLFMMFAGSAIVPAALLNATPAHLRAQTYAVYALVCGLFGGGLGPILYGAYTDYVVQDSERIGISLSAVSLAVLGISFAAYALASRSYPKARALADPTPK